jgi:hypothetical protein
MVTNDISILFGFLERFGSEVQGRAIAQPDPEMVEKLTRFADGTCTEEERLETSKLLQQNPTWLRWVAMQMKRGERAFPPKA